MELLKMADLLLEAADLADDLTERAEAAPDEGIDRTEYWKIAQQALAKIERAAAIAGELPEPNDDAANAYYICEPLLVAAADGMQLADSADDFRAAQVRCEHVDGYLSNIVRNLGVR